MRKETKKYYLSKYGENYKYSTEYFMCDMTQKEFTEIVKGKEKLPFIANRINLKTVKKDDFN